MGYPILYGEAHAPLMVVVGAPAGEDLRAGVPLAGTDGRTLRNALAKAGLGGADHSVLTLVPDREPRTKAEWAAALDRWSAEVAAALEGATPRALLLVGPQAVNVMTGIQQPMTEVIGYVIKPTEKRPVRRRVRAIIGEYKTTKGCPACKRKGCDLCSGRGYQHKAGDPKYGMVEGVFEPLMPVSVEAAVPTMTLEAVRMSGFTSYTPFHGAVKRAARAARGHLELVDLNSYHSRPLPIERIQGAAVAFDIETDMFAGAIERIGFAYRDEEGLVETWTAPWNGYTREVSKKILSMPRLTKVAHNITFDILHLEREGVKVEGPLFCTMHAAALLNPELLKGLEKVAPIFLDTTRWKNLSQESPEYYNAADNTIELLIAEQEAKYIEKFGMQQVWDTMMRAYPTLIRLKQRGIKVDPIELARWTARLKQDLHVVMEEWKGLAPGVVPTSNPAVGKYLYNERGLPARFTKRGGYSVDVDALAILLTMRLEDRDRKTIETLLEIRKLTKLISTYTEAELDPRHRIYADLIPTGRSFDDRRKGFPATGRLACANPNLQQQPDEARVIFIPGRPGFKLGSMDWSQLEIRIIAALSGDAKLAAACEADIHAANMAAMGINERGLAKIILYLTCYGGGARKIAAEARAAGYDISETDAKRFQRNMFREYQDWDAWRAEIAAKVSAQKFLYNPFGRRRPFPRGADDVTKAWDYDPQSSGGDMVWKIIPEVEAALESIGGSLLMIIHDEILFEVPIGADVAPVKAVMEQEWPMIAPGFRVPVSFKVGDNWRDMVKVDGTVVPA